MNSPEKFKLYRSEEAKLLHLFSYMESCKLTLKSCDKDPKCSPKFPYLMS